MPDYPILKNKLASRLVARMKLVHRASAAPFSSVAHVLIHEGTKVKMIRADGSEEITEMKHHRVAVEATEDELERLSYEDIVRRFDKAAEEMACKMVTTFTESLDTTLAGTGNVISFDGPPTTEDMLRIYETVEIDFDQQGRPVLPTIVCGKKMYEHFEEIIPALRSDDAVWRKFQILLDKKREEWRDREARRRLVG